MNAEPQSPLDVRKDWLESRKAGIGGSEVAGIFGLSPYKKPIDVWLDKVGLAEPRDVSEPCEWGLTLEDAIRQAYERRTGWKVQRPEEFGIMHKHPDVPLLIGSPDGLVPEANRGLEIKMCGYRTADWGKAGTDEVPSWYLLQCHTYMAVENLPMWDLCCLFHGSQMEIFTLHRDQEIEDSILNTVPSFWNDYVVPRIPPPVDESAQYGKYLSKCHAIGSQTMIPATPEIEAVALELKRVQLELKALEASELFNKNTLMAAIGENKGTVLSTGDKVQWVRSKPSEVTDYKGLALSLNPTPEKIKQFTQEQARAAYVRLYAGKEK